MILYHYSHSYIDDCSLQNDYNKRYELAEPMLIALRKDIDAFDMLVLSLLYLRRADEDWIDCGDATKEEIKMLEVEVADGSAKDYDQYWYNCAYDAMKEQNIDKVMEFARKYNSEAMSKTPIVETLCSSDNRVVRGIKY